MTQNKLIGVGVFVLSGVLLFAVGLFMIGNRRLAFERSFIVYAQFSRVGGLENGAKVRVAGMDAGEVEEIAVPGGPAAKFRVTVRITERLHPIVRADSVATIQTDGLVGAKFLQVDAGTERAAPAADGSTIPGRDPFEFADLLKQASETIAIVNQTVDELKGEIDGAVDAIVETARDANDLVTDVGTDVKSMTSNGTRIAADLQTVVDGVRQGRGTLGRLVNDDQLYRQAAEIASEAERTVQSLREATEQAKQALADLRDKNGPAQGLTADLRQTLTYARDAMADLADDAEALKRNFLFRGFFNRRGYFDLHELSVQDYRAGALETKDRAALRIWLSQAVLFQRDPNGSEVLTDDGKARIDSAMSQFLKYPTNSPLVVEGYAAGATSDERFLVSRRRAALVREYLIVKFHLDPKHVGLMPLGLDAPGSPSGDNRWQGVALALFVSRVEVARR